MTTGSDDNDKTSTTPSICEEALEEYRSAEDTFAGLIESNHIEIRDFMILSFVCDQGMMELDRIRSILGLSGESTLSCVARLRDVELVTISTGQILETSSVVSPTGLGISIARRIHSRVDS